MMEDDLGHAREDSKGKYGHKGAQLCPPGYTKGWPATITYYLQNAN